MTGRVVLAVVLLTGACSSSEPSTATTVPHTGPARELAPSQLTSETAPPPEMPPLCDPGDVTATVAVGDGGDGLPDQVIDLTNDGDLECDVDIGATSRGAFEMEPSIRLAPGEVGHIWLDVQDDCDETLSDPQTQLWLDVNGEPMVVDLVAVAPCGVELFAFFTP